MILRPRLARAAVQALSAPELRALLGIENGDLGLSREEREWVITESMVRMQKGGGLPAR